MSVARPRRYIGVLLKALMEGRMKTQKQLHTRIQKLNSREGECCPTCFVRKTL